MKSGERRGSRTKDNGPIEHACKIYSLIFKDSLEKVNFTLSNRREMVARINNYTHNV